ncbi:MAG: SiaB family protein kinase [Halothiobacillaceae bacterium]
MDKNTAQTDEGHSGIDPWLQCCSVRHSNLVFYYAGYFSQNVINATGDAVRLRLERSDTPTTVRRKLFSTFIEMTQNIVHYSSDNLTPGEQTDGEMRRGSLCILQKADTFYIVCANLVTPARAEHLRQVLEPLCEMSAEQIRKAYRRQLREETPAESKGAGLGLLTIAKESSRPIEYAFEPQDDTDMRLFTLKATI